MAASSTEESCHRTYDICDALKCLTPFYHDPLEFFRLQRTVIDMVGETIDVVADAVPTISPYEEILLVNSHTLREDIPAYVRWVLSRSRWDVIYFMAQLCVIQERRRAGTSVVDVLNVTETDADVAAIYELRARVAIRGCRF